MLRPTRQALCVAAQTLGGGTLLAIAALALLAVTGCSSHAELGRRPGPSSEAPTTSSPRNEQHASPLLRHRTDPAAIFVRFANGLPAAEVTVYCEDEAERLTTVVTNAYGYATAKLTAAVAEGGEVLPPVLTWCRVIKPTGEVAKIQAPPVRRSDSGDGWRVVIKLHPAQDALRCYMQDGRYRCVPTEGDEQ